MLNTNPLYSPQYHLNDILKYIGKKAGVIWYFQWSIRSILGACCNCRLKTTIKCTITILNTNIRVHTIYQPIVCVVSGHVILKTALRYVLYVFLIYI